MQPMSGRGRCWFCLVAALPLLAGCGGGKDLIDDSLSSPDQIRSLVQQFQTATAKGDDGAACDLMNEQMRANIVLHGVPSDSPQAHCSIFGALFYPGERSSLRNGLDIEIRACLPWTWQPHVGRTHRERCRHAVEIRVDIRSTPAVGPDRVAGTDHSVRLADLT